MPTIQRSSHLPARSRAMPSCGAHEPLHGLVLLLLEERTRRFPPRRRAGTSLRSPRRTWTRRGWPCPRRTDRPPRPRTGFVNRAAARGGLVLPTSESTASICWRARSARIRPESCWIRAVTTWVATGSEESARSWMLRARRPRGRRTRPPTPRGRPPPGRALPRPRALVPGRRRRRRGAPGPIR